METTRYITSLFFILVLGFSFGYGKETEVPNEVKLIDKTGSLFGHTIYIEYLYEGYRGWWVGATDHYNGYIFQLSEYSVYDPQEPCRIQVVDCFSGWACLRTRYKEDEKETEANRKIDTNSTSTEDRRSYYLEANTYDTDWILDTYPQDNDKLKWKIKCTSSYMQVCYITNKYYPNAELYSHSDKSLDTAYRKNFNYKKDDSWFQWRILHPKFASLGEMEVDSSVCNKGNEDAEWSYTEKKGISIDARFQMDFSQTISSEVHDGCELAGASISESTEWGIELGTSTTWSESTETTIKTPVKPGEELFLTKVRGKYGSGDLNPYLVDGSSITVNSRPC